jgi:hypothetical protein
MKSSWSDHEILFIFGADVATGESSDDDGNDDGADDHDDG